MKRLSILLAMLVLSVWVVPSVRAENAAIHHDIQATLDPAARTLSLRDAITLPEHAPPVLALTVSAGAVFTDIPPGSTFQHGLLRIPLTPGQTQATLAYSMPLDAPPTDAPTSMDTPGASAPETAAGQDWTMLMPASRWHPLAQNMPNTYTLRVTAPQGIRAVSQGRLDGFEDREGATVSTWIIDHPVERLGLCAARYTVEKDDSGPVPVFTFLLDGNASLARTYLEASVEHLRFYQELIGPYPLEKFAVVENPLPTGYGFPSYTLLGSQVLRLPFIPATSLRHEIAHCWWGNGVLVDVRQGNWCEALTVYVADYLSQERASPAAARDYRRQALRAFATLVRSGQDFPLSRFGMRFSPASQAVGYGKGMFVFHMLRQQVGDAAFWEGLRRFYAAKLFQEATWEDIRAVFAGLPGFSEPESKRFFDQWLTRTGGPRLKLSTVKLAQTPSGYGVNASLLQEGTPYALRLPVVLDVASKPDGTDGSVSRIIATDGAAVPLTVESAAKPVRLSVDPGADVFRILDDSEIPASVNSLKSSNTLLAILAKDASPAIRKALPVLLEGLGQPKARIVEEDRIPPVLARKLASMDVLYAGAPRNRALLQPPPGLTLTPEGFSLTGAPQADTLLAVLPRTSSAHFTAVFLATAQASVADAALAAGKMTHYGRFSALAFTQGKNTVKTTLETGGSVLVREFR